MINAINNTIKSAVTLPASVGSTVTQPLAAGNKTFNALDVIGSVMKSRMQDGFDRKATSTTAPAAAPKKKKKKKKGLFGKIGGFLKKALGVVSKIANFVPGLNAIAKPLQMVSGFLGQ